MVNDTRTVTLNLCTGPENIPAEHIDWILEGRVCRLVGDEDWMVNSGHYEARLFAYNRAQDVHHSYAYLQDMLFALMHTKKFEGTDQDAEEIPDGDRQRMLKLFAEHEYLKAWVSEGMLTGRERAAFERTCTTIANGMGRPLNEVKQEILDLMIQVTGLQGQEAAEVLTTAMDLDQERLTQINAIGVRVNWRAARVAEEMITQHKLMVSIGEDFKALYDRHQEFATTGAHLGRDEHFERVLALRQRLDGVKDRPHINLAAHDRRDLDAYLHDALRHDFIGAGRHLERSIVAHRFAPIARKLGGVKLRIFTAQNQRGHQREETLARGKSDLLSIKREIDPKQGADLRNNPLKGSLGRINDALGNWNSANPDLKKISELIDRAAKRYG